MPVNLINEKALNEYLSDIVYHGQEMETFTQGEFKSTAYVEQNKDAIVCKDNIIFSKNKII